MKFQTKLDILEETIAKLNIDHNRKYYDPISMEKKRTQKLFCIPWSAGAGKTSTIIEFIAKHWEEGIIYSTTRIDELARIKEGVRALSPKIVKEDHILEFHSQNEDWEELKNNPDKLRQYRVLLVTDKTLKTIPPSILINQIAEYEELDPTGFIRKWIITDEKPTLFNEIIIPKESIPVHCDILPKLDFKRENNPLNHYVDYGSVGKEKLLEVVEKANQNKSELPVHYKDTTKRVYNQLKKDWELVDSKREVVNPNHINSRRARVVLEKMKMDVIEINYMRTTLEKGEYFEYPNLEYTYDISDVIGPTHLNFDGTGDILFSKSEKWLVGENAFPYKFKGLGKFLPIRNYSSISRRLKNKTSEDFQNYTSRLENIDSYISNLCDLLIDQINQNEIPLMITWKDLNTYSKKEDDEHIIIETRSKINDLIENEMDKKGWKLGKDYYLTYWQSGKTRGTNEFIEASVLIALEPLYLPNHEIALINKSLKTRKSNPITAKDIFLAEFIQSIYRTRIRRGEPIKILVTGELLEVSMDAMKYFNVRFKDLDIEFFSLVYKTTLRKNFWEDLWKIVDAGKMKSLELIEFDSKQDLFDTVPRARRAYEKYDSLFQALKEHGIKIIIENEEI